jgi:hypothetical protein
MKRASQACGLLTISDLYTQKGGAIMNTRKRRLLRGVALIALALAALLGGGNRPATRAGQRGTPTQPDRELASTPGRKHLA